MCGVWGIFDFLWVYTLTPNGGWLGVGTRRGVGQLQLVPPPPFLRSWLAPLVCSQFYQSPILLGEE